MSDSPTGHTTSWGSAALLDLEDEAGCVAMVSISAGGVSVHLAAHTTPALVEGERFLRERLPERIATEDQTVPIRSTWILEDEDDKRWKLLILEDTGELLAADAKA